MNSRARISPRPKPAMRMPQVQAPVQTVPLDMFDRATLEEAKKIILGDSAWFRFNEKGELEQLQPDASPDDGEDKEGELQKWSRETYNGYTPMSPRKKEFICAAACLLTQHLRGQSSRHRLEMIVGNLNAPGSLGDLLLSGNLYDSMLNPHNRQRLPINELPDDQREKALEYYRAEIADKVKQMQDDLARREELLQGHRRPDSYFHDDDEGYIPMPETQDAKAMLEHCLFEAKQIRELAEEIEMPECYQSLGNECAEAVRFIEESKDTDFLFSRYKGYREFYGVDAIESCPAKPWFDLVKYMRLQAAPELIASLQEQLRGQSIAHS